MNTAESIAIEVVYALAHRQVIVHLQLPAGTRVQQAVQASGLLERFPEIATQPLHCAIYGRAATAETTLRAKDRVEILRPLLIDPKESRRQAAARMKKPVSRPPPAPRRDR